MSTLPLLSCKTALSSFMFGDCKKFPERTLSGLKTSEIDSKEDVEIDTG